MIRFQNKIFYLDIPKALYSWYYLNGSFAKNVQTFDDLLIVDPFLTENIGMEN